MKSPLPYANAVFFMFNPTSITNLLQPESTNLRFLQVPPGFAVGCDWKVPSSTCSEPPGLALNTFTSQRRSSSSSKQLHEAASEKSKQPRPSQSHHAAVPHTELWKSGFFFISQLAYNWFDLQISLQNDTDRISCFFLCHLARLRPQQVRELLIHGCGTVWDNCNFSSWHPGQGTK